MQPGELKETFNQQASGYDDQAAKVAPIYDGLHFLLEAVFFELPTEASVLCVGVGTGAELVHLAQKFPRWRFTAVEPSGAMLEVCRTKAEEMGFVDRCYFHEGYVDSLPGKDRHDAATCFLVSQFILEQEGRAAFFHSIAQRLKPGGILASSDLASDVTSKVYEELLKDWAYMMTATQVTPERLEQMRATYATHVAILPPTTVAAIIEAGGFETPVQFFQAGLLHAWHCKSIN
ncbi:MAG: class I SAM-dependent methyltransferase [Anaerolineae bacterium]|nr:class I SAM-dependent methyltransferase [Anaerolineae bacterium]